MEILPFDLDKLKYRLLIDIATAHLLSMKERQEAIKAITFNDDAMKNLEETLANPYSIYYTFAWNGTPQGYNYWNRIYHLVEQSHNRLPVTELID